MSVHRRTATGRSIDGSDTEVWTTASGPSGPAAAPNPDLPPPPAQQRELLAAAKERRRYFQYLADRQAGKDVPAPPAPRYRAYWDQASNLGG